MTKDVHAEMEDIVSKISTDMDEAVIRWKRLGNTFDLPYVLKLIAAKHCSKMCDEALDAVYYANFDINSVAKMKSSSQTRTRLLQNMIRNETE